MDKKITLDSIIKTKEEIGALGHSVENNVIEYIDVNTIAHFGNVTCLEIVCSNVCPMSTYNNTRSLGYLLRAIIELLDLSQEDGLRLSKIKNIPCRLVFEGTKPTWGSKCIGIGNFMKNKFVLIEDFVKINDF